MTIKKTYWMDDDYNNVMVHNTAAGTLDLLGSYDTYGITPNMTKKTKIRLVEDHK